MSRLTYVEILLRNLAGEISPTRREYVPPDEARAILKAKTGQDFGHDAKEWRRWLRANPGLKP
jgi:hypothetical protein